MGKLPRRHRRQPTPGEYEDPLSNYEPRDYADELEQSLNEQATTVIEHKPYLAVLADQPVHAVLDLMVEHDAACVVVVNAEAEPVGILSERDVLKRISADYEKVRELPVRELMTPEPATVWATDPPARALNLMVSGGFRHVPVLDADGRLCGTIGVRRVTGYLQRFFQDTPAA
jgi:CBS domain-containing protein